MHEMKRALGFRLSLSLWARLLPLLVRGRRLAELLRRAEPSPGTPYQGLAAWRIVRCVKRACRRPWLMRDQPCLREGLLAYRFLRRAGYRPVLHFGVDRGSIATTTMIAHCWVTLDGEMMLNPPPPRYIEIHRIGGA